MALPYSSFGGSRDTVVSGRIEAAVKVAVSSVQNGYDAARTHY
jgi:cation transport regulator ChaB